MSSFRTFNVGCCAAYLLACNARSPDPVVRSSLPATSTPAHADQRAPQFPVRVAPTGRYLVDQSGERFRLQVDAAWFVVAHASDADVTRYVKSIKSLGFTGFILMNIVHAGGPGWPNLNEPADFYGNQPFTRRNELDTPNESYFARVSAAIDQALEEGLVVEFFHTYLGGDGGDDGWESVITNDHNTEEVCFDWGVYLATRFDQPNIVWMHGGDHSLEGTALERFRAIVDGIRSVTHDRLAGAEWSAPDSLVTDQPGFTYGTDPATSDMQIDSFYGAGPDGNGRSYETASRSWSRAPVLPGVLQEPPYEDAWYAPEIASRERIRATYHWAVTSGAIAGGTVGGKYRWDWQTGENPIGTLSTSPVTLDALQAFAFYSGIPWHLMVPSGLGRSRAGRELVVSGGGDEDSFISASITTNGSHLIAYVPPTGTDARTFSLDLRGMAGNARARWWNPTSGAFANATDGYTLANTAGARSFTTPGNNGARTNDWMLVLDANIAGATGAGGASSAEGGVSGTASTGGSADAGRSSGAGANASGGASGAGFDPRTGAAGGGGGARMEPSDGGRAGLAAAGARSAGATSAKGSGCSASPVRDSGTPASWIGLAFAGLALVLLRHRPPVHGVLGGRCRARDEHGQRDDDDSRLTAMVSAARLATDGPNIIQP